MSDVEVLRHFISLYRTAREAAAALGVSPQSLNNYSSGRVPVKSVLREKLRAFGYYSKLDEYKLPAVDPSSTVPMLVAESGVTYGAFKPSTLFNQHTVAVRATGGSMCRFGVTDGDWLIVDKQAEPAQGNVVLVTVGRVGSLIEWRAESCHADTVAGVVLAAISFL